MSQHYGKREKRLQGKEAFRQATMFLFQRQGTTCSGIKQRCLGRWREVRQDVRRLRLQRKDDGRDYPPTQRDAVEVGELKYVTKEDVDKYGWGCAYNENYVKSQTRCILGASKERIEEYERELAKQEFVHERIEELQKQCDEYEAKIYELNKSIYDYNRLPWYKRIFKKIEVKQPIKHLLS